MDPDSWEDWSMMSRDEQEDYTQKRERQWDRYLVKSQVRARKRVAKETAAGVIDAIDYLKLSVGLPGYAVRLVVRSDYDYRRSYHLDRMLAYTWKQTETNPGKAWFDERLTQWDLGWKRTHGDDHVDPQSNDYYARRVGRARVDLNPLAEVCIYGSTATLCGIGAASGLLTAGVYRLARHHTTRVLGLSLAGLMLGNNLRILTRAQLQSVLPMGSNIPAHTGRPNC